MYVRRPCKALSHRDVRNLREATHFAEKRGKPLNTTITVHPKMLDEYPTDISKWVSKLCNKIRIWCERDKGFGYFAWWVRENYDGERREHLHILLYVPKQHLADLEDVLRRWLPGKETVVKLGHPKFKTGRYGRRTNKALTYMFKQMTSKAHYALHRRVYRETHCRSTGEAVAAVLGLQCGVSRSLNQNTRDRFWTVPKKAIKHTARKDAA